MDPTDILLKKLKKIGVISDIEKARSEVVGERVKLRQDSDLFIRDSIMGMGTVLQEELEKHYYITTIELGKLGKSLCYALILREDSDSMATIQVYGHEGLIKLHSAQKALDKVKQALC